MFCSVKLFLLNLISLSSILKSWLAKENDSPVNYSYNSATNLCFSMNANVYHSTNITICCSAWRRELFKVSRAIFSKKSKHASWSFFTITDVQITYFFLFKLLGPRSVNRHLWQWTILSPRHQYVGSIVDDG